ncbi:hypothetical protein, partial [Pseudomonas sp. 2822-17]|uniref:hypothetical protein n=1 Tax=Pseudomonas sp. 2822-17 TaxID=1712678 RepID=UPI000C41F6A0
FKESDLERIDDMVVDFENLWNNETNGLTVLEIPEIVKSKIIGYKKEGRNIGTEKKRPVIKPRPYQQEAIDAVKGNN